MPITRHFFSTKNFVLTRMTGAVDEIALRRHLTAMNEEAADFSALRELVDTRHMECVGCRSVHDVVEVAALEKGRSWATDGQLAIVVAQPVAFGMARAYLVGVEGIRKDVNVTYSLNDALAFLDIDTSLVDSVVG